MVHPINKTTPKELIILLDKNMIFIIIQYQTLCQYKVINETEDTSTWGKYDNWCGVSIRNFTPKYYQDIDIN